MMHEPMVKASNRAQPKEYLYPTAFCGWGDEERAAIERVVSSGKFTMGEEVFEFDLSFRPVLQRTRCIDEQRLRIGGVAGVGKFNIGIEKPCNEVGIFNGNRAARVEMLF